jgi:1-acyl-sn-glycerol-3-phosphate acyltransferase
MIQKAFYYTLRVYIKSSLHVFYRGLEKKVTDSSMYKGPILYAPNHQNAFMDALAIVVTQPRISYFLTQAKVFQNKLGNAFFSYIFMKPIYRERDGMHTVKRNKAIIDSCVDILIEGKHPLTIFPEGNHNLRRSMRPLQKGIARIAFSVLDKDPESNLRIVPVGINYSAHKKFRSDLYVEYGEPILVKPFYSTYLKNNQEGYAALLAAIEEKLRPVMIDIPRGLKYHAVNKQYIPNMHSTFNAAQDFKDNKQLVENILADQPLEKPHRQDTPKAIKALFAPLWLVMFVNNFIGFKMVPYITNKLAADPAFISSMNLVFGVFVLPFLYLLQGFILHLLVPEIPVLGYMLGVVLGNLLLFKVYYSKPVIA